MNDMAGVLVADAVMDGVTWCASMPALLQGLCHIGNAGGAPTRIGLTLASEFRTGQSLDPKVMLREYYEEVRPYGDATVVDIGHPTYAFFYDVLGNMSFGHIVRTYLGVLPEDFVMWCQESCPGAGLTDEGDRTMVRAGLALGPSASFEDFLAAIRATVPELLGRAVLPLDYERAGINKVVRWDSL